MSDNNLMFPDTSTTRVSHRMEYLISLLEKPSDVIIFGSNNKEKWALARAVEEHRRATTVVRAAFDSPKRIETEKYDGSLIIILTEITNETPDNIRKIVRSPQSRPVILVDVSVGTGIRNIRVL